MAAADRPANNGGMAQSPEAPLSDAAARRAARLATPRLQRELKTMGVMAGIYCQDHHLDAPRNAAGLCPACQTLLDYARKRLAACPYGAEKPTCVNCPIHCYGRQQREDTRQVMRYAGPRMMLRHPVLAIAHLADGRRAVPPLPRDMKPADAQPGDKPPA